MKIGRMFSLKTVSIAVACAGLLASCSKSSDQVLSSTDTQNINSESVSSSTATEAADLGNAVISTTSDSRLSTAREEWTVTDPGSKDKRLTGATITIVGTGTKTTPSGTITIDFGTTGVTTDGVTRKGQIIITYKGRRLQPGSYRRLSFNGFSRNNVQVAGSYHRFVYDSSETQTDFKVTFYDTTNVTLTFPDNTTITRVANFIAVWDLVIATPAQSSITHKAGSNASGTTRKGGSYSMAIVNDLVFPVSCLTTGYALPQSGEKTLTVTPAGSKTQNVYTLTFGSGTSGACTDQVTIEFNGKKKVITTNPDGN
jgi:hypothetical protein